MCTSDGCARAIKNPCSLSKNRGFSYFNGRHGPPSKLRRYAGFIYDYPIYKNSHPGVKKISCKDNQKGADDLISIAQMLKANTARYEVQIPVYDRYRGCTRSFILSFATTSKNSPAKISPFWTTASQHLIRSSSRPRYVLKSLRFGIF